MNTDMKRRLFLKAALSAGAVGVAVGSGLLTPRVVLAAWNEAAFKAENIGDALKEGMGNAAMTDSPEVTITAPDNPENGAVVPVDVTTTLDGPVAAAGLAVAVGSGVGVDLPFPFWRWSPELPTVQPSVSRSVWSTSENARR